MKVRFTRPVEFLGELAERPPNVDQVVRVTTVVSASQLGSAARQVEVLASYVREVRPGVLWPIELRCCVGVLLGERPEDNRRILAESRQTAESIIGAVREAGFTVAAGALEPNG